MPSSILFVHQGYELYGSDRTLIQSVSAAAGRWPEARITVLLPRDGALRTALLFVVNDVRVVDLAILRKSELRKMKLRDVGGLIRKIRQARRMMRAYDVTYINTVMVMDYILAACAVKRPRIIHVHEIPTGVAAYFFSVILALSRAFLIFNSQATRCSYRVPFWQRSALVLNGVASPLEVRSGAAQAQLNLLLLGRFNSLKGQPTLLRAIAQISLELRARLRVRLVGSVFGDQVHFKQQIRNLIEELGVAEIVELLPFTSNPQPHYSWADIVVVPSTKPESFSLVTIEGMATGCSVIASNHGGVAEVVVDGKTGTLVEPGSVESLAAAIVRYIHEPGRAAAEGNAGRKRFAAEFEESHYKSKIVSIIADLTEANLA